MIELYTRHASRGQQLLGAYSQFGWHHPGPLIFYVLAPFYALGGQTVHALNAGALAINLTCVILIVWVVLTRSDASVTLTVALFALLALFLARVPSLMISAWNPHLLVLPFIALVIICAATIAGDAALLPVAVALASFASQAHVGLVPVTQALIGVTVIAAFVVAKRGGLDLQRLRRWTNISVFVFIALWLLPIAEQIAITPGNATRVARYFFQDTRPGPSLWHGWTILSEALTLPFRVGFQVPQGWQFVSAATPLPLAAGTVLVALILIVIIRRPQDPARFERALAGLCLVAAAIGFWSVMRIRETVGDYAVFWLSALGTISLAVVSSYVFSALVRASSPRALRAVAATLLVAGAIVLGVRQLVISQRPPAVRDEEAVTVQVLADDLIRTIRQSGVVHAQLQSGDRWGVAAGVILQFLKEGVPFSVDPAEADFYGRQLAAGESDVVFTFVGPASHERLAARPDNIVAAHSRGVFVDGIRVSARP